MVERELGSLGVTSIYVIWYFGIFFSELATYEDINCLHATRCIYCEFHDAVVDVILGAIPCVAQMRIFDDLS